MAVRLLLVHSPLVGPASWDAVAVEALGAEWMGFASERLPTVSEASRTGAFPIGFADRSSVETVGDPLVACVPPFRPARFWEHLVRDSR